MTIFNLGFSGKRWENRFVEFSFWIPFFGAIFLYFWSRVTLNKSWASIVQIGKSHKLITDGPYKIVRHPIYFSMILMTWTSGLILQNLLTFYFGFLLLGIAVLQAGVEEKLLTRHYPRYQDYAKKVKMIIPFLW